MIRSFLRRLALPLCLFLGPASLPAQSVQGGELPRLESTPCWFKIPGNHIAACAYLYVAENRADPRSAELRLPVARLQTPSQRIADDPILFINGGPGGDAGLDERGIKDWWWYVDNTAWMRKRDYILIDVRGTGLTKPNLNCPEMEDEGGGAADYGGFASWIDMMLRTSDACRDRLVGEGRQLAHYNSAAAAADIADYLAAAQIHSVNIYGASYGTRVAFSLLRDHPQRVRSMVLESVLPPDANLVLQQQTGFGEVVARIAEDCAADIACSRRYPDLEQRFRVRLDELNRKPVEIDVYNPRVRQRQSYEMSGGDVVDIIYNLLYGSEALRYMPTLLDAFSRGDRAMLQGWYQDYLSRSSGPDTSSEGVYYAFSCSEQVAYTDMRVAAAEAARYRTFNVDALIGLADYLICPRWPIPKAAPIERLPVRSDKPVLLLSGRLDPITPAAFGDRAAAYLSHAYHFVLPKAGHAPLTHSVCANDITEAFVDDPTHRPAASCLDAVN
jgi:pimeloyl-ACP methyl ester carboxylesterase